MRAYFSATKKRCSKHDEDYEYDDTDLDALRAEGEVEAKVADIYEEQRRVEAGRWLCLSCDMEFCYSITLTVSSLREAIAHLDGDMEVRLVGDGDLRQAVLAVSPDADGHSLLVLSAHDIEDVAD